MESRTNDRNRRPSRIMHSVPALVLLGCALASCGQSPDLKRLFSMESRSAVGAPPQSTEELKKAIAGFSKEMDRLVELKERTGIYYKILASRYMDKAMYGEAYEALLKAIEYYPANETLYYNAAVSAAYIGKSKEALGPAGDSERQRWLAIAESNYKRAISERPNYGSALYGLAVLYEFELNRPSDALPLLQNLLAVDTQNVDAMLLLGRVYYSLGRLDDALNAYGTASAVTKLPAKRAAAEANRARIQEEIDGKAAGK
jgi:tetratricopeptide (TPR) repeat protein